MEECSHGYRNVPSLDLTWEEEEHLQADWHIWSRQDQIMHQVSILSNILDIPWVYSSGIQLCEGMGCTQSNSKFHTNKLCNIQHTQTHTQKSCTILHLTPCIQPIYWATDTKNSNLTSSHTATLTDTQNINTPNHIMCLTILIQFERWKIEI